jgi:hypothetical protein
MTAAWSPGDYCEPGGPCEIECVHGCQERESMADYFDRTKDEKRRSLGRLGHRAVERLLHEHGDTLRKLAKE